MSDGGIATGVLLAIIGAFVVLRTVVHDATGQNLVDRLVTLAGGSSSGSAKSPIPNFGKPVKGPGGTTVQPGGIGTKHPFSSRVNAGPIHWDFGLHPGVGIGPITIPLP